MKHSKALASTPLNFLNCFASSPAEHYVPHLQLLRPSLWSLLCKKTFSDEPEPESASARPLTEVILLDMMPDSEPAVSQRLPMASEELKRKEVNKRLTSRITSLSQPAMQRTIPTGWRYQWDGRVLTFRVEEMVGEGSFGKVYRARISETKEIVAIKHVEIQPDLIFREHDIFKSLQHRTICQLKFSFSVREKDKLVALLVMEYVPCSLFTFIKHYTQSHRQMEENYVMLLMFQLLTGVAYMHSKGICHRDLKPANILLNNSTNELKICDFGSAKVLVETEENASYVCSRFYRAPEVILSCPYTKAIDLWSVGCIFAELYRGEILFKGNSSVDQLVEIIKVLGTPTLTDLHELGKTDMAFALSRCSPKQWRNALGSTMSDLAVDLISKMLVYSPVKRITADEALRHSYFNPIYQSDFSIDRDGNIPKLFDSEEEQKKAN